MGSKLTWNLEERTFFDLQGQRIPDPIGNNRGDPQRR